MASGQACLVPRVTLGLSTTDITVSVCMLKCAHDMYIIHLLYREHGKTAACAENKLLLEHMHEACRLFTFVTCTFYSTAMGMFTSEQLFPKSRALWLLQITTSPVLNSVKNMFFCFCFDAFASNHYTHFKV